jgi:hypothetical protein
MMVHIAPQIYRKYITVDRRETPVLYVKLQKALYGLMRVSLLFYRKLQGELEDDGFFVNPYNLWVANKDVGDGEQLTIVWHMDNLMATCKLDFKSMKMSCYLAKIYGPKIIMRMGRKHDYLAVDLEFCDDGNLRVSMMRYLENVIEEFPELIVGRVAMPTGDRLFDKQDAKEGRQLEEERAIAFHHTMAQLLFMAMRVQ